MFEGLKERAELWRAVYANAANNYDVEEVSGSLIALIGAGSVGSFAGLALAKMGFSLYVVDFDHVEPHNLVNQFYDCREVAARHYKAQALCNALVEHSLLRRDRTAPNEPLAIPQNVPWRDEDVPFDATRHPGYNEDDYLFHRVYNPVKRAKRGVVAQKAHDYVAGHGFKRCIYVFATDSMTSRRVLFDDAFRREEPPNAVIDARIGMNAVQMRYASAVDAGAYERYWKTELYADEDAEAIPCNQQASPAIAMIAGALIANYALRHVQRVRTQNEIHTPPPFMQFNLDAFSVVR